LKQNVTYYFEEAPVSKAIVHFGVPTMTAMLVFIFYNLVDTFFIGMMKDVNAIAGVTLAMPLITVFMGIGNIFGVGCGSYISRLLGKKDYTAVKNTSAFSFYGIIIAGCLITLLGFLFLETILKVMGASGDTLSPTRDYFSVMLAGGIATMLSFSLSQLVRAEGAAKVSMIGNIIGTATNIILDPIFIFTFGLGVQGAAIATVIANIAAVGYYINHLVRKSEYLSLKISDCKISKEITGATFSIGFPAFLLDLLVIVSSLVQNNIAASYDSIHIAIFGILLKIGLFPRALSRGLCQGVQPLLGYTYAAQETDRLKKTIKTAGFYSSIISVVFVVIIFIAGGNALKIFINDADVVAVGSPLVRISAMTYFTYGVVFITTCLFQATGKAVPAFAMSLSQGIVFVPSALLANHLAGIIGFAWAFPVSNALTMLLGIVLYRIYKKEIFSGEAPHEKTAA
jgi:multidrug efflux pump